MKRKGFIAGILVLSMLLMGTGYAYWTDKLTIETKVDTGDLDVKFVDLAMYGQYGGSDMETGWSVIDGTNGNYKDSENKFSDSSYYFERGSSYNSTGMTDDYREFIKKYTKTTNEINLVDAAKLETTIDRYAPDTANAADKINIDLTDLFPGYATCYQADIVNVGTLTARLSAVKASLSSDLNLETKSMIGISMELLREYAGISPEEGHVDVFNNLAKTAGSTLTDADFFTMGGARFLRLSALDRIGTEFTNNDIYVQPDNCRMDVYFAVAMDPDATGRFTTGLVNKADGSILNEKNDDGLTQDSSTGKITIDFLWDQFNVGGKADESFNPNYHLSFTNKPLSTTAPVQP
ncbi:MAG TPA: SipW-dependent-type signal peptide-containing protein [Lachnospiraceae bacterium]|nr:SipW-dependent-type signal peptide-containing protein [Lachnospiraceae bacterium]